MLGTTGLTEFDDQQQKQITAYHYNFLQTQSIKCSQLAITTR